MSWRFKMKKVIRNLFLVGILFFAISFDSFSFGVAYDKKHKLYPEWNSYGCIAIQTYGKRWERLGSFCLFAGITLSLSAIIMLRRRSETKKRFKLILENKWEN